MLHTENITKVPLSTASGLRMPQRCLSFVSLDATRDLLLPHSRSRSTSYWQSYCAQRVRDGEIHPAKTARCKSSSRGDGLDDEAVSLHSYIGHSRRDSEVSS